MSHTTDKKVNEFTRKMRDEGSAGFGDGPWTDAEQIVLQDRTHSVNHKHTRGQGHQDTPGMHAGKRVPCTVGDRILTGLAIMALGMLIVGAVGAYFSAGRQHTASTTRTEPVIQIPHPAAHDQGPQQVETRLMRIYDTHEKRLENIESRLMQAYDPHGEQLQDLENRLAHTLDLHNQRLRDLEQRLVPASDSYGKRLNDLEQRLVHTRNQYEMRLQDLEQKLVRTAAWLDELTAEMTALTRDNNTTMAAVNTAMHELPPAASPDETPEVSGDATTGPQPARIPDEPLTAGEPASAPPVKAVAATGDTISAPQPVATPDETQTAGEPEEKSPAAPVADAGDTVSAPQSVATPDAGQTAEPKAENPTGPVTAAGDMPTTPQDRQPTSEDMIAWESGEKPADNPAVATVESAPSVQQPAPEATAQPVKKPEVRRNSEALDGMVAAQETTGPWAINLASYTNERIAARKTADFQRKGVAAEQVTASVRDRTVYRVCVPGFATRSAAEARAVSIREQLGLKETWVMKR